MPSVSVIVPVYKVEEYLTRCIDSILNQTFKDFELILVDDGSPDQCGEICDRYAEKDFRVKVIHQKNQGVSAARNNGVDYSSGDYVAFIDSDDWVDLNYLKCLYELCEKNNAQLSICSIIHTDSFKNYTSNPVDNNCELMTGTEALNKYGIVWDIRFRSPVLKLIKKDIVIQNRFPLDRTISEDAACVYKWMFEAERVAATESAYYYYYHREGSAIHSGIGRSRLDLLKTYNEMLAFFKDNHFEELHDHVIAVGLLSFCKYYEICVAEGNLEDAEEYQNVIDECLRKWLSYDGNLFKVKNREDIIPLFTDKEQKSDYISQCASSMAIHLNYKNYGELLNIKKRLKKVLLSYHPPIRDNAYAYSCVFPKAMESYWTARGIISHFTK